MVVTRQARVIVYQERTGTQVGNLFVHEVATGRRTKVTDLDLTTAGWGPWLGAELQP